ncbi:hypothetical protein F2981_13950 [Sinorhizobium meliloti]|nr:hypothetical protein [Sinorhizobium meliloti]
MARANSRGRRYRVRDQRRPDLGIDKLALVHRPSDACHLGGFEHRAYPLPSSSACLIWSRDLVG